MNIDMYVDICVNIYIYIDVYIDIHIDLYITRFIPGENGHRAEHMNIDMQVSGVHDDKGFRKVFREQNSYWGNGNRAE